MRYFFWLLFPAFFSAQTLQVKSPLRFLALGDSYTIGESVAVNERWPVQLKDSLALRGISTETLRIIATTGWRTNDLINAVKNQQLDQQNYNLVGLLIGVNNQFNSNPFSQYKAEFLALVDSAIRYAGGDKNRVFIVSIPDYAFTPAGQQFPNPSAISSELDQYNNYNKHIADSLKITYFNITPISRQGLAMPSLVASDGLHPSGTQYTEWVKLMLREIEKGLFTPIRKIEKKNEQRFTITPNPFSGKFILNYNQSQQLKSTYEVMNSTGTLIRQGVLTSLNTEIDLSDFPDGLYFIRVINAEAELLKQIIKIR